MYACPCCAQLSFTAWRKFGASSTFPARCPKCKGLTFLSVWVHLFNNVALQVLFVTAAIVALNLKSWLVFFVLFGGSVVVLSFAVASYTKLRPIDDAQVRKSRWSAVLQLCLLALFILMINLIFGGNVTP